MAPRCRQALIFGDCSPRGLRGQEAPVGGLLPAIWRRLPAMALLVPPACAGDVAVRAAGTRGRGQELLGSAAQRGLDAFRAESGA